MGPEADGAFQDSGYLQQLVRIGKYGREVSKSLYGSKRPRSQRLLGFLSCSNTHEQSS